MSEKPGKKVSAQHSAGTCEWGTDDEVVAHSRHTLQWIDLDPCSSIAWNQNIMARRIITEAEDCRKTPWFVGAAIIHSQRKMDDKQGRIACNKVLHYGWPKPMPRRIGRIHCNPAGDAAGEIVAHCWRSISTYYARGWFDAAVWVGFNVEQLARLQRVGAPTSPLQHLTLIPPERRDFMIAPGRPGKAPSHAAFITLIGGDAAMRDRFLSNKSFGVAVVPHQV